MRESWSPNTSELVSMLSSDASDIASLRLAPDDTYQTRTVTVRQLTDEVSASLRSSLASHEAAEDHPVICFCWSKCRAGSTPLANVFAMAGVPSYCQPIKTLVRHRLLGRTGEPWDIPTSSDAEFLYVKETGGPYVLAEAIFNPLRCLVDAGYPPSRIMLLVLDREPLSALAAWLARWSARVPADRLVRNYIAAAANLRAIRSYARSMEIAVVHYVHEASMWPSSSVPALFARLGVGHRYRKDITTEWHQLGPATHVYGVYPRLHFPEEPGAYVVPDVHRLEGSYRYWPRTPVELTRSQREAVDRAGLCELHLEVTLACFEDLGLDGTTLASGMAGAALNAVRAQEEERDSDAQPV